MALVSSLFTNLIKNSLLWTMFLTVSQLYLYALANYLLNTSSALIACTRTLIQSEMIPASNFKVHT
jgi:hypothetical protein